MGSDGSIAIVDDDEALGRALARLLGTFSFQIRTYRSGREFLNSLGAGTPACLILDLQMLEMTGLEIARHLADIGLRIPIIFLTARDEPGARSSCEMVGGSAFLLKPVKGDLLLDSINSAMGI
jgi:FixJ family two-component response regulator